MRQRLNALAQKEKDNFAAAAKAMLEDRSLGDDERAALRMEIIVKWSDAATGSK